MAGFQVSINGRFWVSTEVRRNILAYKAPPNNEGYDLICIHPDPRRATKQVRVQVKSRYATDSNRGVPV